MNDNEFAEHEKKEKKKTILQGVKIVHSSTKASSEARQHDEAVRMWDVQ